MVIALALAVMTVILTVIGLTKTKTVALMLRVFIGTAILAVVINYISFCFSYPFTCTIHFRYLASAVPLFAAAVGLWWKHTKENASVLAVKCIYTVLSVFFCILSAVLYFSV